MANRSTTISASLALAFVACAGTIDDSSPESSAAGAMPDGTGAMSKLPGAPTAPGAAGRGGQPGPTTGPGTGPLGPPVPVNVGPACTGTPAAARVWRLTGTQYANTMRTLLAGSAGSVPGLATVAPEAHDRSFSTDASHLATPQLLVEGYLDTARSAAAVLAANARGRSPCMATQPADPACLRDFIQKLGQQAYRRPLAASEVDGLVKLHDTNKAALGADSLKATIAALLMSPSFAFRTELGDPQAKPGAVAMTGYEIASWLSYGLTGGPPDAEMTMLAQQGRLQDAGVREQAAIRLLQANGGGPAVLTRFIGELVSLEHAADRPKDAMLYPKFSGPLAVAAKNEAEQLIKEILWNDDGRLATLLTAKYAVASGPVADVMWGLGATVKGATPQRVTPPAGQRAGLLTHPAVMAAFATETEGELVHRGLLIRDRFLCQAVPPPPANVNAVFPPRNPSLTHRQRFAQHSADPSCAGCHSLLDPIGGAFEHYDAIGRHQTLDQGKPIDASGMIVEMPRGGSMAFTNAIDLMEKLAASADVHQCMVRQTFRYFVGRLEQPGDSCLLGRLEQSFTASGGHMLRLVAKTIADDELVMRMKSL